MTADLLRGSALEAALLVLVCAALLSRSCWAATPDEADGATRKQQRPMRPHLLVTARKIRGLRSVEELRQSTKSGHGRMLWNELKKRADAELGTDPIAFGPDVKCVNWVWTHQAVQRVLRHALVFLITEETAHKDAALEQMEVTFDTQKWRVH